MQPTMDAYNEVFNTEETYMAIAHALNANGACIIGWSDGEGSHHDILFTYTAEAFGNIQSLHPHLKGHALFVSVLRIGSFGFNPYDREQPLHPSYIGEKFDMNEKSITTQRLTDLINGVIKYV